MHQFCHLGLQFIYICLYFTAFSHHLVDNFLLLVSLPLELGPLNRNCLNLLALILNIPRNLLNVFTQLQFLVPDIAAKFHHKS